METLLNKLLKLGQQLGHFQTVETVFSVTEWKEFGDNLWLSLIDGPDKLEKEIKEVRGLWRDVYTTIKQMKAEREIACAAAQALAHEKIKQEKAKLVLKKRQSGS